MSAAFDRIPAELRTRDQWGVWRREGDNKPPHQVRNLDGPHLSKTTPSQWVSFDEAAAVVEADKAAGLAFVLTADDPWWYAPASVPGNVDRPTDRRQFADGDQRPMRKGGSDADHCFAWKAVLRREILRGRCRRRTSR